METVPSYREPVLAIHIARIGDHRTPEGREFLLSRSPITDVHFAGSSITVPVGAGEIEGLEEALARSGESIIGQ